MDALQKWFQCQKRTSWILRCTYQNMPGKQAFSNYLQGCQNLPVTQAFLNDLCCCRKVMIRSILENNLNISCRKNKRYKQYVIHKLDKWTVFSCRWDKWDINGWYSELKCGQKWLKQGFKGKPRIFFFCDLVSWFILKFLVVSRIFLAIKLETICGFMKLDKKISWNLEGVGGFMKWKMK